MKRFLLFAGSQYYPSGGWHDFRGDFDTVEAAKAHLDMLDYYEKNWWHVVDTKTLSIVAKDESGHG